MATATRKSKNKYVSNLYDDIHDVKEGLLDTKDALVETGFDVRDLLGDTYKQSIKSMKRNAKELQKDAEEMVSEYPFKSVGIAFLSGAVFTGLLGILLRRR